MILLLLTIYLWIGFFVVWTLVDWFWIEFGVVTLGEALSIGYGVGLLWPISVVYYLSRRTE